MYPPFFSNFLFTAIASLTKSLPSVSSFVHIIQWQVKEKAFPQHSSKASGFSSNQLNKGLWIFLRCWVKLIPSFSYRTSFLFVWFLPSSIPGPTLHYIFISLCISRQLKFSSSLIIFRVLLVANFNFIKTFSYFYLFFY